MITLFCLAILTHHLYGLIAPAMLLFYGLALVNASKYTHGDVRQLGICEIVLGLLSIFFIGVNVILYVVVLSKAVLPSVIKDPRFMNVPLFEP
jgi:hypothetical protein